MKVLKKRWKPIIVILILILGTVTGVYLLQRQVIFKGHAASGPVQVTSLTDNKTNYGGSIPQYDKFEATFTLSSSYDNPFAPYPVNPTANSSEQVDETGAKADTQGATVEAVIQTPYGEKTIWGFCYDNCNELGNNETNHIWKIRFSPKQTGNYSYYIKVKDRNGTSTSDSHTFSVVTGDNPGFVHANRRLYQFDNGQTFIPRGNNLEKTRDPGNVDDARENLYQNKMNAQRIWMHPKHATLEWISNHWGSGLPENRALGRYSTADANILDHEVDGGDGLHYVFSLDDHYQWVDDFDIGDSAYWWGYNPYNQISSLSQVFTDPDVKRYYKRRLKYILARWGYSTEVYAFELINEHDLTQDSSESLTWLNEMAGYMRTNDINNHLVSVNSMLWTSALEDSYNSFSWQIQKLSNLNINNHHLYEGGDVSNLKYLIELYEDAGLGDRPFVIGEWGMNANDSGGDTSDALGLHNVIWGGVFKMGTAPYHWWTTRYDFNDGDNHFKAIDNFLQGEDFLRDNMYFTEFDTSSGNVESYGLSSSNRAVGWVHDTGSLARSPTSQTRSNISVTIDGLQNSNYTVQFWNTWTGSVMSTTTVQVSGGQMNLPLPNWSRDMAFKVYIPGSTPPPTQTPTSSPTSTPTFSPTPSITPTGNNSVNIKVKFQGVTALITNLLSRLS